MGTLKLAAGEFMSDECSSLHRNWGKAILIDAFVPFSRSPSIYSLPSVAL